MCWRQWCHKESYLEMGVKFQESQSVNRKLSLCHPENSISDTRKNSQRSMEIHSFGSFSTICWKEGSRGLKRNLKNGLKKWEKRGGSHNLSSKLFFCCKFWSSSWNDRNYLLFKWPSVLHPVKTRKLLVYLNDATKLQVRSHIQASTTTHTGFQWWDNS